MISFTTQGDWDKTETFLTKMQSLDITSILIEAGTIGVAALSAATPSDTGETAASWNFEIEVTPGQSSIAWTNGHVTDEGTPVAVLIQYGHGTGTGGYVQGRDFINPAIQPIFDAIAANIWDEVTTA